jgi:Flp pilus assembly protein CpaB
MAAQKKKNGRIIIIIALILIVGLVLVYVMLTQNQAASNNTNNQPVATPTPNTELVDIVVASQTIARGSLITADHLTTIKYPKEQIPQDTFFEDIQSAVGTKAKYEIASGVPLTTSMVIHENEGSLASFDIPSGMTAFSIAISPETAVAYAPQKGDHVMVVGCMLLVDVDPTFQSILPDRIALSNSSKTTIGSNGTKTSSLDIEKLQQADGTDMIKGNYELDTSTNQPVYVFASEAQRARMVCQTIIQDAEVLRVGTFPLNSNSTESATATPVVDTSQATPGVTYPGSVTLIVSPQDTLILNYLELSGTTLSLALRAAGDTSTISTDPVTLQYVMDQKNIPSPAKLPYANQPRVDKLVFPTFNNYIIQP